MARLRLYLLGPPRLESEGVPLTINRRKAIALLCYLATTGDSHSRDRLATLFWPEADQRRARSALRSALWDLNKTSLGTSLAVEPETISLSPESDLWLDVIQFRHCLAAVQAHAHPAPQLCLACLDWLAEAAALYRDDFLAGFTLPDAPEFDEWQFFQVESLRQDLGVVLAHLVQAHTAQGDLAAAIPYARRWLALDSLHESAHRHLMQLYAWTDQQGAAFRQYEACVRLLQEELGVSPSTETQKLYEDIKARRLSAPVKPAPLPPEVVAAAQERGQARDLWQTARELLETLERSKREQLPPFLQSKIELSKAKASPFVTREHELARLDGFLQTTLSGRGQIVFVTGEAGSGKTSLVNEFARRAQAAHATLIVASGVCNVYTGIGDPYLTFRKVLSLLSGDVESQVTAGALSHDHALRLWQLLPHTVAALLVHGPNLIETFLSGAALEARLAGATQSGFGETSGVDHLARLLDRLRKLRAQKAALGSQIQQQEHLFTEYTTVLKTLAAQQPIILLLDDLHWADLSSISLIAHLAWQLEDSPILLIGTYRPEDVAQGRAGQPHPLSNVLSECKRQFGDIWLDLDRAAAGAEGRAFVEAWLDTEPNRLGPQFRARLARHTEGQPLFVVELVREMQARGELKQNEQGHWLEASTLSWETMPVRVEGVIEKRLGWLAPDLREALTVAAVEGEIFTAEVIAQVQGLEVRTLVRHLSSEVDQQHRLVVAHGLQQVGTQRLTRYRFRHNLFQKYLYDRLDPVARVYQHEAVGNALETLYGDQTEEIAAQLAQHFQDAGLPEKAIGYLQQAGEGATRLSANKEAIAHLKQGLTLLEAVTGTAERTLQEIELQLALGNALFPLMGMAAPAVEQAYTRAAELCQQAGETSRLLTALRGLSKCYSLQGEHRKFRNLSEQILQVAQRQQDQVGLLTAHHNLACSFEMSGEFILAREHYERALAYYDPQQHRFYLQRYGQDDGPHALAWLAVVLWYLGYPEQALRRSQEALALAEEMTHPYTQAQTMILAAALRLCRREAQATLAQLEPLLALAEAHGYSWWLVVGTIRRGWALAQQGHGEAGIAQIHQGLTLAQTTKAKVQQAYFLTLLAEACWQADQVMEGLRSVAQAFAAMDEINGRDWEAELYRLKGELLLKAKAQDETLRQVQDEAEACFLKAIEVAHHQEARSWELRAATSLARLWQAQDKVAEAHQILAEIYGWFTEGFDTADLIEAKALLDELAAAENVTASRITPKQSPTGLAEIASSVTRNIIPLSHNLPSQTTPFVGREKELAELARLLADPQVRLLTILGPGGVGKTRLALEAAAGQTTQWPHGVYYVPLAPLTEPETIIPAIAQAVNFSFPRDERSPQQQLLDYFRQKQILLVLDNFEHLLPPSASLLAGGPKAVVNFITDLLQAAPQLKLLVTSRERLKFSSETLFTLEGLDFPAEGVRNEFRLPSDDTTGYSAVQLFLQSAHRVQSDFQVTEENLPAISQICRLVQGMPLGILLAATWVELLPPQEIVEELSQSLDFLATDLHDLPERQHSLRAVFDHSWRRLTAEEQTVFQQLSVFRGGFSREAAEAIAGASLRTLLALVHKSLLRRTAEGRYDLHELLRQYAAEKLTVQTAEVSETSAVLATEAAVRDRHSAYYCSLLQQRNTSLKGPRPQVALTKIELELDNTRFAWNWAIEQGRVEWLDQAMDSLGLFYDWRSRYPEGEATYRLAVEHLRDRASGEALRILSKLLTWQALFSHEVGQSERASQLEQQSLTLLDNSELTGQDTRPERAFLLWVMGERAHYFDPEAATQLYAQGLDLCRVLDNRWGAAHALHGLAVMTSFLGAYDEAKPLVEESLAIRQELGDQRGVAKSLANLADFFIGKGEFEKAEQLKRQALALYHEIGDQLRIMRAGHDLGMLLNTAGKFAESHLLLQENLLIFRDLGDRRALAMVKNEIGWALLHLGQYEQASAYAQQSLLLFQESDIPWGEAWPLSTLGLAALAQEVYDEAHQLFQESVFKSQQVKDLAFSGPASTGLAYVERSQSNLPRARQGLFKVLQLALERGFIEPLWYALPLVALLLDDRGEKEKAVELYTLASRYPHVANSRWFEDIAGRHIAAIAATLPPEVVAAAQERGRNRDLWATARELLADITVD